MAYRRDKDAGVSTRTSVRLNIEETSVNETDIFNYLDKYIHSLSQELTKDPQFAFIQIESVTLSAAKNVMFHFKVDSENKLDDLHRSLEGLSSEVSKFLKYGLKTELTAYFTMSPEEYSEIKARLQATSSYSTRHSVEAVCEKNIPQRWETLQSNVTKQTIHEARHSEPWIIKTFKIYIPYPKKDVDKVIINCEQLPWLKSKELQYHDFGIYTLSAEIPFMHLKKVQYYYTVTLLGRFRNSDVNSEFCVLDAYPQQRDCWKKKDAKKKDSGKDYSASIAAHLEDIIFTTLHSDLKAQTMEIESLLGRHYFSMDDRSSLMKQLMVTFDRNKTSIASCLISVVIGNMYHIFPKELDTVTPENASYILNCLIKMQINQFPSSCMNYMPHVCLALGKRTSGQAFTMLHFMASLYSFLGLENVCKLLMDNAKKYQLSSNSGDSKADAMYLFQTLIKERLINQEILVQVSSIITLLIDNLSIEVASYAFEGILQLHHSSATSESLIDTLSTRMYLRCTMALKDAKACGAEAVLKLWGTVSVIATTKPELKKYFEQEIVGYIRDFEKHASKCLDLTPVCLTLGLFETSEAQTNLLETIVESSNKSIHGQLPKIMQMEKYATTFKKFGLHFCEKWLKRLVYSILQNQSFSTAAPVLYKAFFDASELAQLHESEISKLETIITSFMKHAGLKEVACNLEKIESACSEPLHFSVCQKHVEMLINSQYSESQVHSILGSMCTSGGFRINSRLTFGIVCSLMELYRPPCSQEDTIEFFTNMLQRNQFWERIFKAEGQFREDLNNKDIFKCCQSCIYQVIDKFKDHSVSSKQFRQFNSSDKAKLKSLLYCCKQSRHEIDKMLYEYKILLEKKRLHLDDVNYVLSKIFFHLEKGMQEKVKIFFNEVEDIYNHFDSVLLAESLSRLVWNDIDILIQPCTSLKEVIQSKVFWNLNKSHQETEHLWNAQSTSPEDLCLEDIRCLFQTIPSDSYRVSAPCRFVLDFLEHGRKLYCAAWREIENDPTVTMVKIRDMFCGVKDAMKIEIDIAEKHMVRSINEDVKLSLAQFISIGKVKRHVDAMVSSLNALKIELSDNEDFKMAVSSFQRLLKDEMLTLSFAEAKSCLKIVFTAKKHITDSTIAILESVGNASSLLEFLRCVAEDDIRSLIDAVEDISEQHVTEATVSALIDVKRFFKPLLQPEFEKKFEILMYAIQKQADSIGTSVSELPSKIDECMANLHNLKSLYNNVANRGEQTKQIIHNIVQKGEFQFLLCPELKACHFEVSYKPEKKKDHTKHSMSAINDYRSRALLLMNTDKYKQDTEHAKDALEKFIRYVDLCIDISSFVYQLHIHGHVNFKTYDENVSFAALKSVKNKLNETLLAWVENLRSNRQTFYLMNFLQGKHVHALDSFLEQNCGSAMVNAVIHFIHPDLHPEEVKTTYKNLKAENPEYDQLQLIGQAFHQCIGSMSKFQRMPLLCEKEKTHVTEVIEDGKLIVARIDLKSNLMVRSVLALFIKATGAWPQPNQILFCSQETTWDEIQLILGRCFGAYDFYGTKTLFCVTNIELLTSEVQLKLMEELRNLQGRKHTWLAIVCQCQPNHYLMEELSECVVPVRSLSDVAVRDLFKEECPWVYTYTSEVSGLGKTSSICEHAAKLGKSVKTLYISGPIQKRKIVDRFLQLDVKPCDYLHIDIGDVDNPMKLDKILFEFIVLKYVDTDFTSVELPTDYVAIEIGNTINDSLRNSMTTAVLFQRVHLKWNEYKDFVVCTEINSPVQVVCQYLRALENGDLDKTDLYFTGKNAVTALSQEECRKILKQELKTTSDTSFSTISIFLNVLADQLKKMSVSVFLEQPVCLK